MSVRNVKLTLQYDGGDFHGWQRQPGVRTVQGELEKALESILLSPVLTEGASRTDAGVHALGQVISFRWPAAKASPDRLAGSLSKMLAPDVRVEAIEEAPPDFHAQYSATGKQYAYTLSLNPMPDPFSARYVWCVPWKLDFDCLGRLAERIQGRQDFAGFRSSGANAGSTTRTLQAVTIRQGGVIGPCDAAGLWRIDFHGDGFLYRMVRNITGTFVEIARGCAPVERLAALLASPGQFHGQTAPAHGLTLVAVHY